MSRCVIDTNVPIVANGSADPKSSSMPSINCRIATIEFLQSVMNGGIILLDIEGAIQEEYRRYLNPSGQPGVGDRFYQEIINSSPKVVARVDLPMRADGEYEDMPQSLIDQNFDPSDRKFAALAHRERVPVYHAVDSDWVNFGKELSAEGIRVNHLCGSTVSRWFEETSPKLISGAQTRFSKPRNLRKKKNR